MNQKTITAADLKNVITKATSMGMIPMLIGSFAIVGKPLPCVLPTVLNDEGDHVDTIESDTVVSFNSDESDYSETFTATVNEAGELTEVILPESSNYAGSRIVFMLPDTIKSLSGKAVSL